MDPCRTKTNPPLDNPFLPGKREHLVGEKEKGKTWWGKREKGKPAGRKGKGKTRRIRFEAHSHLTTTPRARTNKTKRFPGHGGKALAALTPPNLRSMTCADRESSKDEHVHSLGMSDVTLLCGVLFAKFLQPRLQNNS